MEQNAIMPKQFAAVNAINGMYAHKVIALKQTDSITLGGNTTKPVFPTIQEILLQPADARTVSITLYVADSDSATLLPVMGKQMDIEIPIDSEEQAEQSGRAIAAWLASLSRHVWTGIAVAQPGRVAYADAVWSDRSNPESIVKAIMRTAGFTKTAYGWYWPVNDKIERRLTVKGIQNRIPVIITKNSQADARLAYDQLIEWLTVDSVDWNDDSEITVDISVVNTETGESAPAKSCSIKCTTPEITAVNVLKAAGIDKLSSSWSWT